MQKSLAFSIINRKETDRSSDFLASTQREINKNLDTEVSKLENLKDKLYDKSHADTSKMSRQEVTTLIQECLNLEYQILMQEKELELKKQLIDKYFN